MAEVTVNAKARRQKDDGYALEIARRSVCWKWRDHKAESNSEKGFPSPLCPILSASDTSI